MQTRIHEAGEKREKKKLTGDKKKALEGLCMQLLFAALGALTGAAELLFSVKPFGVALAAAATGFFPAAALGAGAFYVITKEYLSLAALGIVAIVRLVFAFYLRNGAKKAVLFSERLAVRMLTAGGALLATGVFRLLRGGFRFFDLFGVLLGVLAAALAVFLYAGMFGEKDKLFPYCREAGFAALLLTCIFAMREVQFFGIYPSAVAAALAALLPVAHRGISWGAVGGLLAGFCFDYRLAPAFFLCGLCFGLLEKSSRGGGILCGGGVAMMYAFAVARTEGITLLLPSLLTAGAFFLAGDSAGLVEGSPGYRQAAVRRRAAVQSAKAGAQTMNEERMRDIAGAFTELSATFFELSARMRRPGLSDLRHLCDKAFDQVCPTCRNRDICWGSEYQKTAGTVGDLGHLLQSGGRVEAGQLPSALASRCRQLPTILESINEGALRLSEETLRGDKTAVVAADYAAMGRVLSEAVEEGRAACEADMATGERIVERLQRLGYVLESVAVCGRRRRRVVIRGIRLPGRHLKVRELRQVLEQHCHCALGMPEIRENEGVQDMIFEERRRFSGVTVREIRAKGKGEGKYCGDSTAAFSTPQGADYAFICDGMGSGNQAALTSAIASAVLSRFLQSGVRPETALRMLNGLLTARGSRENESSTTVDLLEIDRVSGEASLFKCGAAPSYLLRNGEITKFSSRTAPVGILESLDGERIRFSVQAGDVILQVSDGVTKGEEECPWLCEMLKRAWDGNREDFVRKLLNRAATAGDDDVSVMLTEIKESEDAQGETFAKVSP